MQDLFLNSSTIQLMLFPLGPSILTEISSKTLGFLELLKLSLTVNFSKVDKGSGKYVGGCLKKQKTVLCVGGLKDEHLLRLRKAAGPTGKLIVFAPQTNFYNHLVKLILFFKWMNVVIEPLEIAANKVVLNSPLLKGEIKKGAKVINISDRNCSRRTDNLALETLDAYCLDNDIQPNIIEIDILGFELEILKGASVILKKYKPKVIVKCNERAAGRAAIFETFTFLTHHGYNGHFTLDTVRIPIRNFDFDVYQNPHSNFYCNQFIFE